MVEHDGASFEELPVSVLGRAKVAEEDSGLRLEIGHFDGVVLDEDDFRRGKRLTQNHRGREAVRAIRVASKGLDGTEFFDRDHARKVTQASHRRGRKGWSSFA